MRCDPALLVKMISLGPGLEEILTRFQCVWIASLLTPACTGAPGARGGVLRKNFNFAMVILD
jgi:hypothetical protein